MGTICKCSSLKTLNYLNEYFTKSIVELNEELAAYEEKIMTLPMRIKTRKKIAAFESVQKKISRTIEVTQV